MSHSDRPSGRILLLNKPYGVLTRFSDAAGRNTLRGLVDVAGVYPVGRLDADSEGLLLLTDRASLVEPLLAPGKKEKRYLACLEGEIDEQALERLRHGVLLKDGPTRPARVRAVTQPEWLWPRQPPIRFRKAIPTCWIELALTEGRNRQVRRMTAAVGFPTLRLIRIGFGPLQLGELPLGQWREASDTERRALEAIEEAHAAARRWPGAGHATKGATGSKGASGRKSAAARRGTAKGEGRPVGKGDRTVFPDPKARSPRRGRRG
jgi:23S rRNA pseudouridine2457 synthase